MTQHTTRILPRYDSAERPPWLVHGAKEALCAALPTDESIDWSEFVVRACDEMATAADGLPGFPGPGSDPPSAVRPQAGGGTQQLATRADARRGHGGDAADESCTPHGGFEVAMAAELLGGIATRAASPYEAHDLCRTAYPRCWDSALDEAATSPHAGLEPDPVLYDHSVSLRSVCEGEAPRPAGMYEALDAVMELAHDVSAASSLGLSLAHVAPSPVVWPPPEASPALSVARRDLDDALAGTRVSQQEDAAMLHSYLWARDNPDVPDPSPAEVDRVQASVQDWYGSVVPAAVRLATATFAHAYEWASVDTDRWDPAVIAYAHTEAYLSIHHLRQITDSYDLTNGAVYSYAWWWCHDRRLGLAGLRELASNW
ncbi:hypothetical protein [Candidatus Poriferisodalis sp.]|uniref:hypothetical protein n=1 Tax=Candidatus Poriferisodalis sp. TaxID=3101277 RepID=UPI003AF88BBA